MHSAPNIFVKSDPVVNGCSDFHIDGLALHFRIANREDESFLLSLSTQRHEEELAGGMGDVALVASLAAMQAQAQFAGYTSSFPRAERWIVCGAAEAPVGYFIINLADDHWRLVDIVIMERMRGRGIGGRLVQNLQVEAERIGVPMRLSVVQSSKALYLYKRLGFTVVRENGVRFEMEWKSPEGRG